MENQTLNSTLRRLRTIRNHIDKATTEKSKIPFRVLITGAAGNIGYSLAFMIGQGRMFGPNQPVIIHLFDLPAMAGAIKGIAMEITDCAFDLVKGIVFSTDPAVCFKDIDFAVFCGARPRGPGMERKDLLSANAKIFEEHGKYLEKYSKKTVKVLVVGNPANTNALILSKNAPSINPNNFTALTRLDHNRAISQITEKLNINNSEDIKNLIIWGNHSATQYPDIDFAYIESFSEINSTVPLKGLISDEKWVQNEFIKTVQQRGAAIIAARKLSSAASAANAACDHIRDWVNGTKAGEWTSMAVISKGEYGAPSGVIFSFPVTIENGQWKIVQNLKISEFAREKINITGKELIEERTMALN